MLPGEVLPRVCIARAAVNESVCEDLIVCKCFSAASSTKSTVASDTSSCSAHCLPQSFSAHNKQTNSIFVQVVAKWHKMLGWCESVVVSFPSSLVGF